MEQTTADQLIADLQAVIRDAENLLRATAAQGGEKLGEKFQEIRAKTEKTVRQAKDRLADGPEGREHHVEHRADIGWWMITLGGEKTRLVQGPNDDDHRELAEEKYVELRKLRRLSPEAVVSRTADVVEAFLLHSRLNHAADHLSRTQVLLPALRRALRPGTGSRVEAPPRHRLGDRDAVGEASARGSCGEGSAPRGTACWRTS